MEIEKADLALTLFLTFPCWQIQAIGIHHVAVNGTDNFKSQSRGRRWWSYSAQLVVQGQGDEQDGGVTAHRDQYGAPVQKRHLRGVPMIVWPGY